MEKKENILVWHCAHLQILWPNVCWHFPAGAAQDAAPRRHRRRYMPTLTNTTFLGLKLKTQLVFYFAKKTPNLTVKVIIWFHSRYRPITVTLPLQSLFEPGPHHYRPLPNRPTQLCDLIGRY